MEQKADVRKKMLTLFILDILERCSDKDHTLSQKEIQNILANDEKYKMSVERKAIKRSLQDLIDAGYDIQYESKTRGTGKKANDILTDFYIERDFTNVELKYLIDSVVFSRHIPPKQKEDLIKKLEKLSSKYFSAATSALSMENKDTEINPAWFWNLELLDEAIDQKHSVKFNYYDYGEDKKLHLKNSHEVNPYRIVAKNDHYYLICQEEPFDNLVHYRIDKIKNMEKLENEFLPIREIRWKEYLAEHPYMSSGKSELIRLRIAKEMVGNLIDWFGDTFRFDHSDDKKPDNVLDIRLNANPDDFFYWALQYGKYVEVQAPQELRDRIRDTVQRMSDTYLTTWDDKKSNYYSSLKKRGTLNLARMIRDGITLEKLEIDRSEVTKIQLVMDDYEDFSFLQDYPNLEDLIMKRDRRSTKRTDMSFLSDLIHLTRLYIRNTGFQDFTVISMLPLKRLSLREETVENIDCLYEMKTLKYLTISSNLQEFIDFDRLKKEIPGIKIMMTQSYHYE
ncbi:MAG: WYL domain-containing protein [Eubacteriales bacterium]|nr:WYL domain-containing protein [Eubacteriales bacterium]